LLARYEMEAAEGKSVPMSPEEKTVREGESFAWEKILYSELVGSLLYLSMCTRPDIAQAIEVLARYMSAPTKAHWRVVLGVVHYLAVTATCGLTYGSGVENHPYMPHTSK
jgi:hypothetical protein